MPRFSEPGTDLTSYLQGVLAKDFSILQMPLGARLEQQPGGYLIIVPRIQLFDGRIYYMLVKLLGELWEQIEPSASWLASFSPERAPAKSHTCVTLCLLCRRLRRTSWAHPQQRGIASNINGLSLCTCCVPFFPT